MMQRFDYFYFDESPKFWRTNPLMSLPIAPSQIRKPMVLCQELVTNLRKNPYPKTFHISENLQWTWEIGKAFFEKKDSLNSFNCY